MEKSAGFLKMVMPPGVVEGGLDNSITILHKEDKMIHRIGDKEAVLAEKPYLSESQDWLEKLHSKSWFFPPCALCPHPCSLRKDKAR